MADIIEARRQRRRTREPLPWHPAVLPPPGFRLDHDGVTFEAVTAEPHTRSRYPNVWLVTWRTHCIDCGAEITTRARRAAGAISIASVAGNADHDHKSHPDLP